MKPANVESPIERAANANHSYLSNTNPENQSKNIQDHPSPYAPPLEENPEANHDNHQPNLIWFENPGQVNACWNTNNISCDKL